MAQATAPILDSTITTQIDVRSMPAIRGLNRHVSSRNTPTLVRPKNHGAGLIELIDCGAGSSGRGRKLPVTGSV